MASKKQTKADKAFIDKIGTIGINTGAAKKKICADCGNEMPNVGFAVGTVNGEVMASGPLYLHPGSLPERRRAKLQVEPKPDEQSFSA